MSDVDTGTMLPPIDQFLLDDRGLTAWAAVFDKIAIDKLPDGRRRLIVTAGSKVVYQRTLSAAESVHLAGLLSS